MKIILLKSLYSFTCILIFCFWFVYLIGNLTCDQARYLLTLQFKCLLLTFYLVNCSDLHGDFLFFFAPEFEPETKGKGQALIKF